MNGLRLLAPSLFSITHPLSSNVLSLSLSLSHTHTHTHTRARAHTHTLSLSLSYFKYKVVSKIFKTDAVKIVKLTIRPIGHHHPRSSSFPHADAGPTFSSIFGTLHGSPFLSVSSTVCDSACISSIVSNRRPFSFSFIFGNRKKSQGAKSGEYSVWGMTAILFFSSVQFSADVDMLLLLVSCQDPGHKFGCDTVHAQFFLQNPLACPITNFHLLTMSRMVRHRS